MTLPKVLWSFLLEARTRLELHGTDSTAIQQCVQEKRVAILTAREAAKRGSAAA